MEYLWTVFTECSTSYGQYMVHRTLDAPYHFHMSYGLSCLPVLWNIYGYFFPYLCHTLISISCSFHRFPIAYRLLNLGPTSVPYHYLVFPCHSHIWAMSYHSHSFFGKGTLTTVKNSTVFSGCKHSHLISGTV